MEELIEDILARVTPLPAYDRVTLAAAILATAVGDTDEKRLCAHERDIADRKVCVAIGIGAAQCRGLAGAVETMAGVPDEFPKLTHVSFWWTFDQKGRRLFRCTYRVRGYKRRTDRLGRDGKKAYKWAQQASETIGSVHARLLKPEEAHRLLYVDRSPIDKHVDAFDAHLRTKGVNEDYRKSIVFRIRECLKLGDVARVDQITLAKVGEILQSLRARVGNDGGAGELAAQTINQYLRHLKQFVRWMKKTGRIAHNPIEDAEGVKENDDDGRRRDATREELTEIYAAAMRDPSKHAKVMPGPDRAMLYLTAFCTGLRRKELREMSVDWLNLGTLARPADEPYLTLPKKFAKGKKRAIVPLPTWLASALLSWLGDRTGGLTGSVAHCKVFPTMPEEVAPAFERDRESARQAWLAEKGLSDQERAAREESNFLQRETSDGLLVFHSLRHGYGSELLESGADAKLVQHLMRHSTITLTFDRYGHVRPGRAADAVESAFKDPRRPEENKDARI